MPIENPVTPCQATALDRGARPDACREASGACCAESVEDKLVRADHYWRRIEGIVRRALDIGVSLGVLILTLPLMLLIALIIRLDSPGPALFWQTRMTRNRRGRQPSPAASEGDAAQERRRDCMAGRPFRFVKFRTMFVDARERFPEAVRLPPQSAAGKGRSGRHLSVPDHPGASLGSVP